MNNGLGSSIPAHCVIGRSPENPALLLARSVLLRHREGLRLPWWFGLRGSCLKVSLNQRCAVAFRRDLRALANRNSMIRVRRRHLFDTVKFWVMGLTPLNFLGYGDATEARDRRLREFASGECAPPPTRIFCHRPIHSCRLQHGAICVWPPMMKQIGDSRGYPSRWRQLSG